MQLISSTHINTKAEGVTNKQVQQIWRLRTSRNLKTRKSLKFYMRGRTGVADARFQYSNCLERFTHILRYFHGLTRTGKIKDSLINKYSKYGCLGTSSNLKIRKTDEDFSKRGRTPLPDAGLPNTINLSPFLIYYAIRRHSRGRARWKIEWGTTTLNMEGSWCIKTP